MIAEVAPDLASLSAECLASFQSQFGLRIATVHDAIERACPATAPDWRAFVARMKDDYHAAFVAHCMPDDITTSASCLYYQGQLPFTRANNLRLGVHVATASEYGDTYGRLLRHCRDVVNGHAKGFNWPDWSALWGSSHDVTSEC
jgi:hypothetical protein